MEQYLELVRQAKHGSTDAFASLYQEVYEDLYRFAVYVLQDPADAQDAVSETVTDAFASIGQLRSEQAFRGWIFRILSAKCKRRRKEYTNRTVELSTSREIARQLHMNENTVRSRESRALKKMKETLEHGGDGREGNKIKN